MTSAVEVPYLARVWITRRVMELGYDQEFSKAFAEKFNPKHSDEHILNVADKYIDGHFMTGIEKHWREHEKQD